MNEQHSDGTQMLVAPCVPKEAEQERAPVDDQHELQPAVILSIRQEDRTLLTAIINRTASRAAIIDGLRKELPKFAVPYRNVDQRILEAIRVKFAENLTDEQAALCVFGDASYARSIRYWRNRWELQ